MISYIVKTTAGTVGIKFSKELNCHFGCTDYSFFFTPPFFRQVFKSWSLVLWFWYIFGILNTYEHNTQ